MKASPTSYALTLLIICWSSNLLAQKNRILVDVAHGQKFYSDPNDKISTDLVPTPRLEYITGELRKSAGGDKAEISYLKTIVTPESLTKTDLLFIHVPSIKYSVDECEVIRQFLKRGGSLFIAIEEDYWATLSQVNANDIVSHFGIKFSTDNSDKSVGGHSAVGEVTKQKYSIPFHGARNVEGGHSFAFSNQPQPSSFAVYAEVKGGGKIVAMGDAMVSLYMTSWQGVNNYECAPFMRDVVGWLLK